MTAEPPGNGGSTDTPVTHRYDRISLGDDGVIVYDRDQVDAWIHSSVAYELPPRESTPEARHAEPGDDDAEPGAE